MNFKKWLFENEKIESSQGDGWKITTPYGYIDYRPRPEDDVNEIWWIESNKKGHGSELVHLMLKHHPAKNIAWGVTSQSGKGLMEKFHRNNPNIGMIKGAHDGQFDPFGNHEDEDEDDFFDDD